MACALLGANVTLTDFEPAVLASCAANLRANASVGAAGRIGSVDVRRLDWLQPLPSAEAEGDDNAYGWTADALERLEGCSTFVAADVIYEDRLTDGLCSYSYGLHSYGLYNYGLM